jgi:hypothetical protein
MLLIYFIFMAYQVKSKKVTITTLLAKTSTLELAKHPIINSGCTIAANYFKIIK